MKQYQAIAKLPALFLLGATMLLALSVLIACGTMSNPAVMPVLAASTSTATLSLPTTTAIPPTTTPVNDKYAGDARFAADLTEVAQTPRTLRTVIWPTLIPHASWPPGVPYRAAGSGFIIEDGLIGMSPSDFKGLNKWVATLADRRVIVFAGGEGSDGDRTQGVLIVMSETLAGDTMGRGESYTTPTKAGPVTITDAVGERLTLQADDGTRFTFDVATRQWVNP